MKSQLSAASQLMKFVLLVRSVLATPAQPRVILVFGSSLHMSHTSSADTGSIWCCRWSAGPLQSCFRQLAFHTLACFLAHRYLSEDDVLASRMRIYGWSFCSAEENQLIFGSHHYDHFRALRFLVHLLF